MAFAHRHGLPLPGRAKRCHGSLFRLAELQTPFPPLNRGLVLIGFASKLAPTWQLALGLFTVKAAWWMKKASSTLVSRLPRYVGVIVPD